MGGVQVAVTAILLLSFLAFIVLFGRLPAFRYVAGFLPPAYIPSTLIDSNH